MRACPDAVGGGRRRNPTDWTYDNVPQPQYINRGYTMHEMLDEFGLINMNGRCYDPVVGRFLSPDIIVQNPNNTQCYNRYSYCINNPLKYSDPSGWSYGTLDQMHDNALRAAGLERNVLRKQMEYFMNTHRTPKEPRNLFGLFGKNGLTGTCDGAFQLTIKEIVNLLKITGVAGIFGNPGGGDTPEYDYSSGTDFTSGDGWPPDGSIDFAPWRAQQNDNTNNIENGNISNSDNSSNNSKVDYSPDLISGDFHLTSVWVAGGTFSKNLMVS